MPALHAPVRGRGRSRASASCPWDLPGCPPGRSMAAEEGSPARGGDSQWAGPTSVRLGHGRTLKQQTLILSQLWRLEVPGEGEGGLALVEDGEGEGRCSGPSLLVDGRFLCPHMASLCETV